MENWRKNSRKDIVMVDVDALVPKDHLLRKIEAVMEYGWLYARLNARTIRHFRWVSRPAAGSKGCGPCGGRYDFRTRKTLSLGVAADNQQKTL